ncbi:hypothetical protein FRC08_012863 [Ceratobasidium sp. 394]|nr:hypothetical protein FRC08_012863 [Ceratobasidium sp. 394]
MDTEPAFNVQELFPLHLARIVGSQLEAKVDAAADTVYLDPERQYLPKFPTRKLPLLQTMRLMDLYFDLLWGWFRGRYKIPYALLECDSTSGTYALTDHRRYPAGIVTFRSPFQMPEEHVWTWRHHLIAGDNGDLSDTEVFVFIQVRPGEAAGTIQDGIHPESTLRMPPESLAYARSIRQPQLERPTEARPDQLPVAETDSAYVSLSGHTHAQLVQQVGPNLIYAQLLDVLRAHDMCMPYQAPQHFFTNLCHDMPLLKPGVPDPNDDMEFFETVDGIFLPRPCFAPSSAADRRWRLYALLRWSEPSRWVHKESNTLMGGAYAVKWAVLLLILLRVNELVLADPEGRRPSYYRDIEPPPVFSSRDSDELRMTAEELYDALKDSMDVLESTLPERSHIVDHESTASDMVLEADDVKWHEIQLVLDEWSERGIEPEPVTVPQASRAHGSATGKKRQADQGQSPPKKTQKTGANRRGRRVPNAQSARPARGGRRRGKGRKTRATRSAAKGKSESPEAIASSESSTAEEPVEGSGSETDGPDDDDEEGNTVEDQASNATVSVNPESAKSAEPSSLRRSARRR